MANPELPKDQNWFYAVRDMDNMIHDSLEHVPPYFALGGGSAAALAHPDTKIYVEDKMIVPPVGIEKPVTRDNGSKGDIDTLVLTTNKNIADEMVAATESIEEIGVGVTALDSEEDYVNPRGLKKATNLLFKDFVSHRVMDDKGQITWRIGDVVVPLPEESFQKWTLELPFGGTLPVMHPVVQLACYAARPSHGIRPRDIPKVKAIHEHIHRLFNVNLYWRERDRILDFTAPASNVTDGPIEFVYQKNRLRYHQTYQRMGRPEAAWLATKIALHRPVDRWEFTTKLGQGGWLFDKVLSKASGER